MKKSPHPVAIMGLPVSSVTPDEVVQALERMIVSGSIHQVCSVNLDAWLETLADPHLHRIMARLSMILPDGRAMKWVSGLLGCPVSENQSSVDLVGRLAALSAQKNYKIFLLGSGQGVTSKVAELLERKHPGVSIVGKYAPVAGSPNQLDRGKILKRVHATQPDILLVDSGDPKQEEWIWMHRNRLGVPLTIGVAGSFADLANDVPSAPKWIQRCGLDWMVATLRNPVRKWPQSLNRFFALLRQLPMALLAARLQRPFLDQSRITTAVGRRELHLHVYGRLGAESAAAVQDAATKCILNGLEMVVHSRSVRQATIGGFGVLLDARRQLLEAGLPISLTGLNFKTRFLLRAWHLQRLFDDWQPAVSRKRPWARATELPTRVVMSGERGAF